MTLIISRVEQSLYELREDDGTVIKTYQRTKMTHPHDWEAEAEDAGYAIDGASGWKFVDEREY